MRRTLAGSAAFLAFTGTFVILPVYAAPGPKAHPIEPAIEEVALGSVAEPEGDAVVTADGEPTDPVEPARSAPTTTDAPRASAPTSSAPTSSAPTSSAPTSRAPTTGESAPEDVASSGQELPGVPALTVSKPDTDPFSAVGVTWSQGDVTDVVVQLRVKDDDGDWGRWTTIGSDDVEQTESDGADGEARGGTAPYWTGEAHGIEVIVQGTDGAVPDDVKVALVDPGKSSADKLAAAPAATGQAHAAEVMPPVYSRAQWGADESIRTWDPQYAATLKAATIHHTADRNTYSADEVPAMMRSIYAYHTVTRGWGDIGYNVIVDRFGRMFEGRYGGLASTVIGAHAGGFNSSTFGVSMLGNYDTVRVPQAVVDSITEIVAWKFGLYGIDPQGTTVLTSGGGGTAKYPAGQAVALPTIFGHKDVGNTVCPGTYGYGRMDEIRTDVAARLPAYDVRSVQQRNSLTGHITDVSPVLVSSVLSSNGATTVFGRGADNAIWYRTGRGVGTYSAWASIPGAIATSGPAAVSSDGTRVDVVVRGAGNAVYQASSTLDPSTGRPGTWSSWMSLGGALTTAPGIASVGANKSAIVGRGTDGAVWQRVWDGAGWSEWASLGGYAWSSPSIEADNVNGAWRYVVSVVGTDLGIWRIPTASMTARPLGSWYGTGDFSGHGLGNANTSSAYWAPKALTAGGGDHSVFLVDPGSNWGAGLGGSLTSTASATRQPDNSVVVFARGTDNRLWMIRWASDGMGTWMPLDGSLR
ncbi:MAG TPA: N-acetylmuramoyl-L-alanine amidase [Blastococcus sp.]